jgi:hypothetical protein
MLLRTYQTVAVQSILTRPPLSNPLCATAIHWYALELQDPLHGATLQALQASLKQTS